MSCPASWLIKEATMELLRWKVAERVSGNYQRLSANVHSLMPLRLPLGENDETVSCDLHITMHLLVQSIISMLDTIKKQHPTPTSVVLWTKPLQARLLEKVEIVAKSAVRQISKLLAAGFMYVMEINDGSCNDGKEFDLPRFDSITLWAEDRWTYSPF